MLLPQTAIMEIRAILKTQTDAAAAINRLEEVAGFRGIGSWIPEAAACTLLIRYIRENFKIATFSLLSGIFQKKRILLFHLFSWWYPVCFWLESLLLA